MPSECLTLYEPSGKPLRPYGQKDVNFFAEDGQKVTIKFDVANVVGKVCTKVPGGMARITPKQSKQSLGLAERFHGTVESDCRVLLLSILNS